MGFMGEKSRRLYGALRVSMAAFVLAALVLAFRGPLWKAGERMAENPWLSDFIWAQAYPEYMGGRGALRRLFAAASDLFSRNEGGRGGGQAARGFPDPDPSYRSYIADQWFLKEHPYIRRRLAENTAPGQGTYAVDGGSPDGDSSGRGSLDGGSSDGGSPGRGGLAGENAGGGEAAVMESGEPIPSRAAASFSSLPANTSLPVTGREYVREQLADYDFLMKNFYSVHANTTAGRGLMNAERFLEKDFYLPPAGREAFSGAYGAPAGSPQILIYHTHGSETYADYSENQEADIVHVGAYLAELLKDKGYAVIHDTSRYDMYGGKLDRSRAYNYSLEGVMKTLQKYPSIEVILDIHRDGVAESTRLVTEVSGKPTAQIMFFNGTSQTPEGKIEYLPNPNLENNLAFSFQLKLCAEAYYPGYTRKIYLKGLRYNLHLRGRSALVEVGAQNNTYAEARNAMEPLAELLDMVLRAK